MALVGYPTSVPVWVSFLPPQVLPKTTQQHPPRQIKKCVVCRCRCRRVGLGLAPSNQSMVTSGFAMGRSCLLSRRHAALRPFFYVTFFSLSSCPLFYCYFFFSFPRSATTTATLPSLIFFVSLFVRLCFLFSPPSVLCARAQNPVFGFFFFLKKKYINQSEFPFLLFPPIIFFGLALGVSKKGKSHFFFFFSLLKKPPEPIKGRRGRCGG